MTAKVDEIEIISMEEAAMWRFFCERYCPGGYSNAQSYREDLLFCIEQAIGGELDAVGLVTKFYTGRVRQ